MKTLLVSTLCAALLSAPTVYGETFNPIPASSINTPMATTMVPIFSQKLSFQLPTSWHGAYEKNNANMHMIEFIPTSEDINQWENMVSLQGFKGLAKRINSKQFLDSMFASFKSACADHIIYQQLPESLVSGYDSTSAILGCANVPGGLLPSKDEPFGEIGYFLSIQGKEDIYLLHKSIRTEPFATGKAPLSKANAKTYFETLLPIELCDSSGEAWQCLP